MRQNIKKQRLLPAFLLSFFAGVFLLSNAIYAETTVPNVVAKPWLDTSRKIQMTCGGTKVELVCGYNQNFRQTDDRICSDNTLIFTLPDGQVVLPKIPEGYSSENYTPISISCRYEAGKPQNFYIYTRNQNGSYNCMKDSHNCNIEMIFSVTGETIDTYGPDSNLRLGSHGNTISLEERNRDYPIDYLYEQEDE